MIIEEAANYYYKDGMEEKFAKKVFEPRSLQDFKNLYRYNNFYQLYVIWEIIK